MAETRLHTCMLCEAVCGLEISVDGERATRIRGDASDPFSRGHICPKAAALDDIRTDPDRVTTPRRRAPGTSTFVPVSWRDALDEATTRLAEIQDRHGDDAVALSLGNPTVHSYAAMLGIILLWKTLGTRTRFSATSVDQLPQMLASLKMFGSQTLLPVPDIDRTSFFLILGANPVVSNGSIMTAPDVAARLKAVRARGGRIVVVDPRRSETADLAGEHCFIRPGTDALLVLAMLNTIFREGLARPGRLGAFTDGMERLAEAAEPFAPEAVAPITGIGAEVIRGLARDFANAPGAVAYGRVGLCTQEHGGVAAWLVNALNVVTGNLDRVGGVMFTTPAADLSGLAAMTGEKGSFGSYTSRVRGLPEFGGELPLAVLAEEIETEGAGQIRGLVTFAGNPVLSAPNGARVGRALQKLDFMVSVDIYENETTRHANLILPTTFGLERDHFDLVLNAVAVRNTARYVRGIFAPAGETRADFDILADLAVGIAARRSSPVARAKGLVARVTKKIGPRRLLDGLLRIGPHRLSIAEIERHPHGLDLGPLEPRLPGLLANTGRRIDLVPAIYTPELLRLRDRIAQPAAASEAIGTPRLTLIGRRQLRSNNSWMHNSLRLVKGREACTLLMNPDDARARGLKTGQRVRIASRVGAIVAPVEVSNEMAVGSVSLPHGWGHARESEGSSMRVAARHAGVSVNDITDEHLLDGLTGTASFSGVQVDVSLEIAAESVALPPRREHATTEPPDDRYLSRSLRHL